MFVPHYQITHRLLANIKRVTALVQEMNNRRFPKMVLLDYTLQAREQSAFASTSIEGNPLSLTEVKRLLRTPTPAARDSEQEVINYNSALEYLSHILDSKKSQLSTKIVLDVHHQVVNKLLPSFEVGKFRKKPVVVNDPRSRQVVYLPPDHHHVPNLTNDLLGFVNQNIGQVDSLILAGIFHKQLVLIHPFMDGNGRTTRLLTKLLLAQMGLNTFNLFSFENYYNLNVSRYFQAVGEVGNYYDLVDRVDFTRWLEYFTGGIIDELVRVSALLPLVGQSPATRLESHHQKILAHIRQNGFITDREYSKLTSRAKATRVLDFHRLLELELIERRGQGRSTHYVLTTLD